MILYKVKEAVKMSTIRKMQSSDKAEVIDMMRVFYASDAVYTNGSQEIFENDVDTCLSDSPYLEGYIFESGGDTVGYAMVAKSYSTEFGKPCIWLEDLYVKDGFRKRGICTSFFKFIEKKYEGAIFRLEVERENTRAISVYTKNGFDTLPYVEMKK